MTATGHPLTQKAGCLMSDCLCGDENRSAPCPLHPGGCGWPFGEVDNTSDERLEKWGREMIAGQSEHDLNMPHDMRSYPEVTSCPPNCPARGKRRVASNVPCNRIGGCMHHIGEDCKCGPVNLEITMEDTVPEGSGVTPLADDPVIADHRRKHSVVADPGWPHHTGFTVKDSGKRQEWESGFVRDSREGKPDYTLLPLEFLERWAMHMTRGAEKYGRDNWRLANDQSALDRFKASALGHMMQWLRGDRDEDHAAAVAFNVAAAEYVARILGTCAPEE